MIERPPGLSIRACATIKFSIEPDHVIGTRTTRDALSFGVRTVISASTDQVKSAATVHFDTTWSKVIWLWAWAVAACSISPANASHFSVINPTHLIQPRPGPP